MTQEQADVLAKLTEIETQGRLLLEEMSYLPSLQRTRINHIVGIAGDLRTQLGTQLTLVKKSENYG